MGVKAEIHVVAMPFSSLIPALTSGRIDMIGDAIYATAARKQIVDFTDTTFYNPESLDVAKGNPGHLHALKDLCGKAAGTYEGTTYVESLRKASAACPAGHPVDIHQYPTIQNVFADLSAGRIDGAVVDSSLSAYALKQNPALSFELVGDYIPEDRQGSGCAFGIAKGSFKFPDGVQPGLCRYADGRHRGPDLHQMGPDADRILPRAMSRGQSLDGPGG